jgi:hypothetical protein
LTSNLLKKEVKSPLKHIQFISFFWLNIIMFPTCFDRNWSYSGWDKILKETFQHILYIYDFKASNS